MEDGAEMGRTGDTWPHGLRQGPAGCGELLNFIQSGMGAAEHLSRRVTWSELGFQRIFLLSCQGENRLWRDKKGNNKTT